MLPFAVRTGLEPATPGVTGRYSNQLNYRTNIYLCVWLVLIRLQIYGKLTEPAIEVSQSTKKASPHSAEKPQQLIKTLQLLLTFNEGD